MEPGVTLASLRPVLEYGWPPAARWLAAGVEAGVLEQPVGRPVAYRLRIDGGWRFVARAELPEGRRPALAWVRIGVRESGGAERTVWQGALARAGRGWSRAVEVDLGFDPGEVDLVLHAAGLGADRVRWTGPVLRRAASTV